MKRFIFTLGIAAIFLSGCAKKQVEMLQSIDRFIGTYDFTDTQTITIDKEVTYNTVSGTFTITKVSDSKAMFSGDIEGEATFTPSMLRLLDKSYDDGTRQGVITYVAAILGLDNKSLDLDYLDSGTQRVGGGKIRVKVEGRIHGVKR